MTKQDQIDIETMRRGIRARAMMIPEPTLIERIFAAIDDFLDNIIPDRRM